MSMRDRLLNFLLLPFALQGCASVSSDSFLRSDGWLSTTYQAPQGPSAQLLVTATEDVSTPLFVEICTDGKWQKAAVLGNGLVRTGSGGIFRRDMIDLTRNPSAAPLPDRAQLTIPAPGAVSFRIRSHGELTGQVLGRGTISSCSVASAVAAEVGASYRATWSLEDRGCSLRLTRLGSPDDPATEQPLQTAAGDPVQSCGG